MAADFQRSALIDLSVQVQPDLPDLTADQAAHLLAIVREGLSNIAKHAGASQAIVDLSVAQGSLRLTVSDNGAGFDLRQSVGSGHHGLSNLRSRAIAAGGSHSHPRMITHRAHAVRDNTGEGLGGRCA